MRTFNLKEYQSGKAACTLNGINVIDLHLYIFNNKGQTKLIVQLEGIDELISYDVKGKCENKERPDLDLFMVASIKKYWINIFRDEDGDIHFSDGYFHSKETAQFWAHHQSMRGKFIKSLKVYEEEK